jgi:peroxiredoxin (alkyl hydroperoxide reductase subunit C)
MKSIDRLKIGDDAPDFTLPATGDTAGRNEKRKSISLKNYRGKKNVVLMFFPASFTPICTAQLPSFEARSADFVRLNAQLLAVSTDNLPSIESWCTSLGGLSYPVLSDFWPHGHVALKYGVLRSEGIAERSVFVIDNQGKIRHIDICDIGSEPPVDPILAAVEALR